MGWAGPLSLILFGFLAFVNAVRHPFVHDDVVFILNDPRITQLNHWPEVFRMPLVSDGLNTYYRPVLEILYRFEYCLFAFNPSGFHLFNIIVHIINGLLIFKLLQKLGLREAVSWVIACIFLVHPVQTEAVCCISGISNLWMAMGVLLALNAYLNKWYLLSFMFFVIAFLSKEQAILFVPLLVVIDYSRGEKNYRAWCLWGITACLLLWVRQFMTGASLYKDITASGGELLLRLAAIPRDMGMYLQLIFCPYDLHYFRHTDILQSNTISWAGFIASLLLIFYVFRRWPLSRWTLILGLGWFAAALLPVLNIVSLISEYSLMMTPEHFLYLPIVGILILVVAAADGLLRSYKKLILGAVLSACLLVTWHQNTFWESEVALFERMLRFEPDFGRGHLLLAKAYYFKGLPQQAEGHFERSFGIISGYAKKTSNMTAKRFYFRYMKEILFDWAQNESALALWALALDKYKQATVIDNKDPSLYNNMAIIYINMGDKKDAYLNFKQALRIDPSFIQARNNLAQLGRL